MTVYIDSNTFAAIPALYADAEKKKPLPRVLPAVQLREGKLNVAFLGDRAPTNEMVLSLSAVLAGTQTQILAEYGDPVDGADVPTWEFPFALNSQALADVLADKQRATLLVGVIATAEGFRREWQIVVMCDPTATGELDPEQVESVKTFADAAKRSADNAAESESNAALFATDSAKSATASAQSASASAQSASNAETSEDNAKASEDNAKTSETNASESASEAAQSKADAQSSASSAATSATNASNSASAANTSAGNASNSATAAATSANNAAQSASLAKTSETNAKASETAAKASETASATSATNAATSETNAANSESAAKTSEENAKASEIVATTAAAEIQSSAEQIATNTANIATNTANIATNTANIDWLMMSGDGDWRTYMLTRSKLTGKNSYIAYVKTAIQNPESTEATLMKQAHTDLWLCENFMERRLPDSFWAVLFDGIKAYVENPTDVTLTSTYDSDTDTFTSNSPYFDKEKSVAHIADFSVVGVSVAFRDWYSYGGVVRCAFGNDGVMYFPRLSGSARLMCGNCSFIPTISVLPKVTNLQAWATGAANDPEEIWFYAPSAKSAAYFSWKWYPNIVSLHLLGAPTWNGHEFFTSPIGAFPRDLKTLDLHVASPISLALGTLNSTTLNEIRVRGTAANITSMRAAYMCNSGIDTNFTPIFDDDEGLVFPVCTDAYRVSFGRRINKPFYFPALKSAVDAFYNGGLSAANIAITLNSLPAWDDGEAHVISFRYCSGIPHTATAEAFTFTDEVYGEVTYPVTDGVGCPTFNYDDENQTLRKAFALATIKKGWDVVIA